MLTYSEVIKLRDKLVNGEISVAFAKEHYWKDFKEGNRSWYTKDWKERRGEVLKDKCQICGSKDTLTLQHRSHPKEYNEYAKEVTREYTKVFIDSNPLVDQHELREYIMEKYDYVPVPLCPNCEDRFPNKRLKKLPRFYCKVCRYEFDEPKYKLANELIDSFYKNEESLAVGDKCFVKKDTRIDGHNLSSVKYWLLRDRTKTRDADSIAKKAFLLFLNDTIKYLSFEDTITTCRRCASNYDLHQLELCPVCKKNYKGIQFKSCIQCLPEDKRTAAMESIKWGKEWHATQEKFGID